MVSWLPIKLRTFSFLNFPLGYHLLLQSVYSCLLPIFICVCGFVLSLLGFVCVFLFYGLEPFVKCFCVYLWPWLVFPLFSCSLFHKFLIEVEYACGSAGKESTCNVGDLGLIAGLGRSLGEGKGYPLQYSGLENSMDHIVHGVANSRTWLSKFHTSLAYRWASQVALVVKNLPANAGDVRDKGSMIPGSRRSPRWGHGNPLQYSCLKNPMDRGAWQVTVHMVAKSWTQLK